MRQPTTRRSRVVKPEVDPDAISEVLQEDADHSAEELAETLDELRSLQGAGTTVVIYKINKMRGKWEYVREAQPPIDTVELMDELRRDWGSGDYGLRVRAGGKIQTTKFLSIAEAKAINPTLQGQNRGGDDFTRLLIEQSNSARAEQGNMFQLMMTMMQNSSAQQMAAMTNSTQMMMGLVTAIMTNKENPADVLAKMAEIQRSFNPDKPDNMAQTLETLKALKDFLPSGEGGGNDDIVSMGLKALPALLEAGSRMIPQRQQQDPAGQLGMPQMIEAPQTQPVQDAVPVSSNRILALIGDDVLHGLRRGHPPDLIADLVIETLDRHEVPQDELLSLAAQFQSSTNWLDDLAKEGINLRAQPVWANQLLTLIIKGYMATDVDSDTGIGVRDGGSATNLEPDAAIVKAGKPGHDRPKQGAGTDTGS